MIAKKEWFKRRKYLGWGVEPKTWQGWAYIGVLIVGLLAFQFLPFFTDEIKIYITLGWIAFMIIDILPIMFSVERDEREYRIEAIAERNAAWFMMGILVIGLLYDITISAITETINVNWFIVVALLGGAIVKTISNIYLDKKGE